ncbi:uncharacterized protein Z518_06190 [Rhinocladiella mackenziei CBS 650.93]|uniref:Rhinocladiella mackenziei CBS 650.93 unplaced genomic scaffold supercont1.4, whole genome shotgun sequence n=1 Tax=Rhinocladiella mackenziei CBS 650.93 TaxID=1442369 RepID=A0A0D2H4G6_9EURO|nr:uncharacterized protein Z518_06190 [Rhinocladiella mackenziei CBS 650.93]KIX05318.1 hypothetical protein Z518_06190 [Rhinocladiella mackenziei CBS 650.93]
MSSDTPDKAVPTDSSSPLPDPKKLRLSCDNCHAAKVKCTKERPFCSRCGNSGVPCVYSKSRRAGKPKGCGKNRGQFSTLPTPPEFNSRPDSPLEDGRLNMDHDEGSWSVDIPGTRRSSFLDQGFGHLHSAAESTHSLDPTLTLNSTFTHAGSMDSEESAFNTTMFASEFKTSPDWVSGMDSAGTTIPFSTDRMATTCAGPNVMLYNEFISDGGGRLDDSSSGLGGSPSSSCSCLSALQEILSALNAAIPSFDRFLAINKSAVVRMTHCLSCHCLPDISSVMLLSVIITRIVQCYKKIRNGECQGSEDVGVTMGTLKMDSEDEYQIKMFLIRSELRKIKSLITRFRDRFENFLQGADRQLYEANMAFLEYGLDDTIKGL